MELNTIQEINKIGLDAFVEKYKLKYKDFGHKFLLKYDQLNTPKNKFTNECRGLVIARDYNGITPISVPFYRFSSYNDTSRKSIDWDSATYWEKTDGTMIHYYWDPIAAKWCVGTTGSPEGIDNVSKIDKINRNTQVFDFNLTELFFRTCEEIGVNLEGCQKGWTYIFELATEYNQVVNKYNESKLKLLGARDLNQFEELDQMGLDVVAEHHINCERPKQYDFKSEQEALDSLKNVKFGDVNFEGYVVVDKDFNRVKMKSNTYVVYHQFNGESLESKYRLVDIALANEVEEVGSTFPKLKGELEELKSNLDNLLNPLRESYEDLKGKVGTLPDKDFFIAAQTAVGYDKKKKVLLGVLTSLKKNPNKSFDEVVSAMDKKKLYKLVK